MRGLKMAGSWSCNLTALSLVFLSTPAVVRLGLIFDRDGNLIVADAIKGLLSVNKTGEIKLLAAEADGVKFGCLNDLDVGADGTIYFTEASHKFPMSAAC